jgi:hypothetical protein
MAKIGLETDIVAHAGMAMEARGKRDSSTHHKAYMNTVKKMTGDVEAAIKQAQTDPELGVVISRECIRFTMLTMPDPAQEPGRATSLSQCQALEDMLAKVRKPEQYLTEMKKQFGPNLDPRQFPTAQDAFHSIIKSQRNKIYTEGKGLNIPTEQIFCRKRIDLLSAVEKGYDLLRDQALGINRGPKKDLDR